jgi:hypothetical protein
MINNDFSKKRMGQKIALLAVNLENYSTKTDRGRSSNIILYFPTKGFGLEFDRVQSELIFAPYLLRLDLKYINIIDLTLKRDGANINSLCTRSNSSQNPWTW